MPLRGRHLLPALTSFVLACALALPALAAAQESGVLSPELSKLASPAVQSRPPEAQAAALGVPAEGPGSLQREDGEVAVEIQFEGDAFAALPALREAGAEITAASDSLQLANATIAPSELRALAAVPGVASVEPVREPILNAPAETAVDDPAICEGGTVLSEGIDQLGIVNQPGAEGAREAFGTRGKGETIGVLSDSYNVATTIPGTTEPIPTHAREDIQGNNLPGLEGTCSGQQVPVKVLEEGPADSHDEGRAMLQIVHDIAPHAQLAFASAFNGELAFARNIEKLAAPVAAGGAGADVIVDDVSYFEEPMFQDGPVAAAVAKVTAAGVTYLSSAGNNNLFPNGAKSGLEIASWETPTFRDTKTPAYCEIPVGVAARHCLDFDPTSGEDNTFAITVLEGVPLKLAVGWAEPWYGDKADLDAYLLRYVDPKVAKVPGEKEVVSADARANVNRKTSAVVGYQNPEPEEPPKEEELFLVVNRCFGSVCAQEADSTATPRTKVILLENGAPVVKTEYQKSVGGDIVGPTIFGHNGTAAAISVGATSFSADGSTINTLGTPEAYSSRGPETHYYGPVLSTVPAAKLATPEVVEKPDIVATDCGANNFFGRFYLGFWRFCGTSAAAPHAAGVIALMHQANSKSTPIERRAALTGTAKAVSGFGPNVVGKGLIQARQAVAAVSPFGPITDDPPSTVVSPITPTPPPPPPVEPVVPVTPPAPSGGSGGAGGGATGGGAKTTPKQEGEKVKPNRAAPKVRIAKHPAKLVKSRVGRTKVSFLFKADQSGASFECSMDKGSWSRCGARYKPSLLLGPHEVRVRARGGDDKVGPTASFKFEIKLVA